jgi:hypothetical protein
MKRNIISGALALLLVIVGCARKPSHQSPPEIVNNVEGSFTFKDQTVKLSHAYARRVKNEGDKSKQDVLIVFTDRPTQWRVIDQHLVVCRYALSVGHYKFWENCKSHLQKPTESGVY